MTRAAAIIISFLCFVTAIAQTHQHGSQPSGDGNFNPSIVPDRRGGFYLAYIRRANGSSNVMIRHSTDGNSFSDPVRVNDHEGDATVRNENPPKIAVAANGNIYVCWANERARWKGNIKFARSTDGGKSFSSAITINSDSEKEPTGHAFQSVAVDKTGRIYVAWIDERNKRAGDRGAEIWMSQSIDEGKTFSSDHKIISDVCECCRTNIQLDPVGRLFLAYRTVPAKGPMYRDIIVARSNDRGKSFVPVKVSEDGWEVNACPVTGPGLSVDSRGQVAVVWFTGGDRQGLYYAASTNHGASYSGRRLLESNQNMGKHAQAVALADGRVFVAWDEKMEKVQVVGGLLDLQKGRLQKSVTRDEASYPAIAFNGKTIVITGMQSAPQDIWLQTASETN